MQALSRPARARALGIAFAIAVALMVPVAPVLAAPAEAPDTRPAEAATAAVLDALASERGMPPEEIPEIGRELARIWPAMTRKRYDEALEACARVLALADGMSEGDARWYRKKAGYNRACIHALEGQPDEALRDLEEALRHHYWDLDHVRRDSDLESLHARPEWEPLLARAAAEREAAAAQELDVQSLADALEEQWRRHHRDGKHPEALPIAERLLELREGSRPAGHPELMDAHTVLGATLSELSRLDETRAHFQAALSGWLALTGEDSNVTLGALNNLQHVLVQLGRLAEALPVARAALQARENLLGAESREVGQSLNNLAQLLRDLGRRSEARPLLERALSIAELSSGPDSLDVAGRVANLGGVLADLGDLRAARRALSRALEIQRTLLPAGHPDIARSLQALARVLEQLEGFDAARPPWEEALALYERALGPDHPLVADQLEWLGVQALRNGDPGEALRLAERVLAIRREKLGERHPDVASALVNIALALRSLGHAEGSEAKLREALALREELLGAESPELALPLHHLGQAAAGRGDLPELRRLYERVLGVLTAGRGPTHPDFARARQAYGRALAGLGERDEGRRQLEQALALGLAALGSDHPEVAAIRLDLSRCLLDLGAREEAAAELRIALAAIQQRALRTLRGLSSRQRLAFLAESRRYLDAALSTFEGPEESLQAVLFWKGLWQRAGALERSLGEAAGEAGPIRERLLSTAAELDHELRRAPDGNREDEAAARAARVASISATLEDLERRLARLVPRSVLDTSLLDLSAEDVAAALERDDALVELLESRGELHAWILRPGRSGPARVEQVLLGPSRDIRAAVLALRRAATDPEATGLAEAQAALGEIFWEPLRRRVVGARRLFVAPDGPVADLPFGLLPGPSRADGAPGFLLEQRVLVGLVSGADLIESGDAGTPRGRGLLTVGGVSYGASGRAAPDEPAWEPLPSTAEETEAVSALWLRRDPAAAVVTLAGELATPSAVVAALQGRRSAHLATHGFFPAAGEAAAVGESRSRGLALQDPAGAAWDDTGESAVVSALAPWTRSGLVLAGDPPNGEDGLLSALEISGLDLGGLELCVLSACGSGLGEARLGQGVIGLSSAFLGAGTRSLVTSLWSVPDEATRELIERFYSELWTPGSKTRPAEALRRAQLALLARQREEGEVRPLDWAGWVMVGRDQL